MYVRTFAGAAACSLALCPFSALAHGVAGSRFFPATLAVEDPFVSDEASFPTISSLEESGSEEGPKTRETEFEFEFAKRITPRFGLSVGDAYVQRHAKGEGTASGFGNVSVGARYEFLLAPKDELVASLDLGFEIGGTGAHRVETDRFSTFSPTLLFGKGFGTLPDSLAGLRPFALTGAIGADIPFARTVSSFHEDEDTGELALERERVPRTLNYGFTLQYSLAYLQDNVRDMGFSDDLRQLTPLVEFAFETPLDGRGGERTTGTINPGLIWSGKTVQIGAEAIVPINTDSGASVGFRLQLHLYVDDLFRDTIGKPLFGG